MNKIHFIISILLCLSLASCGGCSENKSDTSYLDVSTYSAPMEEDQESIKPESNSDNSIIRVPYTEQYSNTITIPVKINGMGLDMIYDTGASNTTITLAEAKYLHEKGLLIEDDFIGKSQFQTADGSIHEGLSIIIRKLEIGDKILLYNIEAVILENQKAPLLLGQSVMKRFREVSVDRENKVVKFLK